MPFSVNLIKKLEAIEPPLREILIALLEEVERQREVSITRKEFLEFAKTTEENFQRVWKAIEELAEAQKKTEIRVNELAEAQKKTEQRLESLTEKVEALAEAQKRTEEEVRKLAKGLRETRQMVGGLSDTVGYSLEDRAIKSLPQLLREQYQIEVKGRLVRKFIKYNGLKDELNIFGEGESDGKPLYILGEAKARLSKKHIDRFLKKIQRLKFYKVITEENFMFFVTYSAEPQIEEYAKDKGIEIIWSYEV